ncbi:efflux RND transporter periplasmic adaptor subunit [Zavarzinella formosa]|uniref:efflux RND transporter periplasmic adaptor subunit n=1 Tax=Zavarzinella formosa TaxID=360055 RepID=UPI00031C111B|nr:efflux RND transporter periplasmic adaptor subunit [Zavarzinella formosa]
MTSTSLIPTQANLTSAPRRRWRLVGGVLVAFSALGAAATQWNPLTASSQASPVRSEPAGKTVTVVNSVTSSANTELLLPAQLLPYEQTTLFARVDGYIGKWHVDRGARVKAGDLLAEIDAPELDQQANRATAAVEQGRAMVAQLRADLEQVIADVDTAKALVKVAEANRDFAASEAERLSRAGLAASRTEAETSVRNRDTTSAQVLSASAEVNSKEKMINSRKAAIETQLATVKGLEAEAKRLKEMQNFKRITAPFDGTITRRYAETGTMLSTVSPQALFHIQSSAILRVQVDVPQGHSAESRMAKFGYVIIPELTDKPLKANVARTANALDPTTRTLRIELELPNADRAILAGTYAQVRLSAAAGRAIPLVPISALRHTPQGVEVVIVNRNKTEIRPVKLGRDYGRVIEVLSGLTGEEQLVANPTNDLAAGETVAVKDGQRTDGAAVALAKVWPTSAGAHGK